MTVRDWKYEDILKISQLEKECFFDDAWDFKQLASSFESENFCGLAADDGGEVIGYGGITIAYDEADVANIAVSEPFRFSGVGGSILDALIDKARSRGVKKVFLEVRVSNSEAMKLYLKHGFVGSYARPRYYKNGEDCLVMVRQL